MVKVFPTYFSFIEKQRLLTAAHGEPVAVTCSEECVFVAEEGCLLEIFSLASLQLLGQVRTVNPVKDLVYNAKGDCIVTLERKSAVSHGFARVYFQWRGASVDKPMRISLLHSFSQSMRQDHLTAEIIELPGDLNSPVTCLACCAESGRIAVGMDTTLRIFTLHEDMKGGVSNDEDHGGIEEEEGLTQHSIDILLDIHTNTRLHRLSIFSDYVAFISTNEVRVLKLSLLRDTELHTQPLPFVSTAEEYQTASSSSSSTSSSPAVGSTASHKHKQQVVQPILEDKDYVKWSPSRVWEEEKAVNSSPISTSSSLVDLCLPILDKHRSHDSRGPSPIVGTLSLPSVYNSTTNKMADKHAIEVLGPVEYVWGQPIRLKGEGTGSATTPTRCRVLTMLYRRFAAVKTSAGDSSHHRSATLPSKEISQQTGGGGELGLHTVQLLPVIITDEEGSRQLIGISCFVANKFHGYLYDVHLQGHLACSFSFMSPAHAVVCDDMFLHALSAESVETYTSRSLQTAILHMPTQHLVANSEWLHKPCPSPSMDLTLVSANQFVSSWCLASSQNHMVVITKSSEHAQSSTSWLASLSPRKSTELSWNIYILEKKDTTAMFQEFSELSSSLQDSSPPMYHHLLCEGHNLLRSQILLKPSPPSSDLVSSLRDNCLVMAESLCRYNTAKTDIYAAAKYLVLSKHRIRHILQVFTKFPRKPSPAYSILMKFLDTVLFDSKFYDSSLEDSEAADSILQLYAEFRPITLPRVLLDSWIDEHFTPSKALQVTASYLQNKTLNTSQIFLGRMCELLFLLRLDHQQESVANLRALTDTFFSEWLANNLNYLVDQNCHLTKLGQLLLENRVGCLLEVFYRGLGTGDLQLELLCAALQPSVDGWSCNKEQPGADGRGCNKEPPGADGRGCNKEQLAMNLPLKHFLDGIFLGKVPGLSPEIMQRGRIFLVDVLVARLTVPTPPPSTSTPFLLYGSRHKWLDSLPPFDSSSPKPSQVVLQDLMQLQALLCSCHQTRQPSHVTCSIDHMTAVASHVEDCMVEGMVGELSLQLLTWPHTGKLQQAVQKIFQHRAALTVEYCEIFLPPKLWHWKMLLDMLCDSCYSALPTPSPLTLAPQYHSETALHRTLYRAALNHVVTFCSTEEFLGLLPASGALSFFLPFIEKSCKLELSKLLARHLANTSI